MNRIISHSGGSPQRWVDETLGKLTRRPTDGGTLTVFTSASAAMIVDATHTDQCGVAESADVVVAFKGFLHGPEIDDTARYDATVAAAMVLDRYRSDPDSPTAGLWGRYQVHILDRQHDRIVIATDPYGSGECYTALGGQSTAATSLAALALGEANGLTLDRSIEDFMLVYGFVPRPKTLFVGAERVGAATTLVLDADGHRSSTHAAAKPWPTVEWDDADEPTIIEHLHDGFMRAVAETAPPEDDVAVLLGGFDSALVAAALAKLGKRVHTYTFRYQDDRYNQPLIDEVATLTGGTANWVTITPELVAEGFERYAAEVSAPTNWPAYVVQTRIVAEQIRADGFGVALSGDGCDNLFFGYPLTFRRGQVVDRLSKLPSPVLAAGRAATSNRYVQQVLGRPAVVGSGVFRNAQLTYPARGYLTFRIFEESALTRLRQGADPRPTSDPSTLAAELAEPFADRDSVQLSYLGKKCLTPSSMKIVASNDVCGVSIVSPYQHAGMVDLAKRMPTDLLRPTGPAASAVGKYALAKMAEDHGLLPAEIIHQPKLAAADAPIAEWYAGPMRSTIESMLDGLPFEPNPRMVDDMLRESLGERLYQRVISGETSNVANLHHDISLLATYGAMAGLRSA